MSPETSALMSLLRLKVTMRESSSRFLNRPFSSAMYAGKYMAPRTPSPTIIGLLWAEAELVTRHSQKIVAEIPPIARAISIDLLCLQQRQLIAGISTVSL